MTDRIAAFRLPSAPTDAPLRFAMVTENDMLTEVRSFWDHTPLGTAAIALNTVELCAPLPHPPSKMLAIGMNYPAHIDEMKHVDVPADPVLFLKAPSTLLSPHQPICADAAWGRVDYEGELAVVIGKTCKNVPESQALDYVLGYTVANDVTARELQRKDTQWGRAKNFDTFCPLGPYLLLNTGQNPADFHLETRINGNIAQQGHVADIRFSIPFLIAYISGIMTLNPGDVILTGTPQGVAPLSEGDVVQITVPGIGTLENSFSLIPSPVGAV